MPNIKTNFFVLCTSILILFLSFPMVSVVNGSEESEGFTERFKALVPPPNSSVHSDYLFEQIALGSEYTVRTLDMIHTQNRDLNEKYDLLLEKYDTMIRQNKDIIELLKKIEKKGSL